MQPYSLMDQLSTHVQHGDHMCVVCEDPQERLRAAAQYLADGLRRNEFVMYAADPETTLALQEMLSHAGIDVDYEMSRGALNLPDPYTAYLTEGRFDPGAMYVVFEKTIAAALEAGFSGCRFAGEPMWALEREELRPDLIEFEKRLNTLFHGKKAAGFCVYDKKTWPAEVIRDILRTHPIAVVDDMVCNRNVYFERPVTPEDDLSADNQVNWMLSQLRELRIHDTRLQVAVDAGQLGTWELDLQNGALERSRRFDVIFGYKQPIDYWGRDQLISHVVPEDQAHVEAAFDAAIANGGEFGIECRIQRHDDHASRWIEMRGRLDPPKSERTRPQRLLGIIADITERKEMERALREADRRKDEFLATLAHELRNPLAPIFNVLHLMQMKYAASADLQSMHGVIDRQVRHLSRLVDDLLDVSRITTGCVALKLERVDLRAVLKNAAEATQPLINASLHEFAMSLPPQPVYLEGDVTRLTQVFQNILTNAAKYTPKRGRIDLDVEQHQGQTVVRVRDTGIGLDPALIPRMFDMFVQGHRVGDRAQGGLGVGLSLAKQLILLHGGEISAKSEGLGHGCEISVYLPSESASANGSGAGSSRRPRSDISRRVLVLDDNVDAADTLAASLVFMGHDVRTQYNGEGALEEVARWIPDVAILDIGMPGMDGYEVARRMRMMTPDTKLIALTGWGQANDLQCAFDAGFELHRTKPVDLTELMAIIAASAPVHDV